MTDVEHEIENALHYLSLAVQCEKDLEEAERRHAWDEAFAARRSFLREFAAFLNAARTARNYLIRNARANAKTAWLMAELGAPTFKFHADLAGVTFHDGLIAHNRAIMMSAVMMGEPEVTGDSRVVKSEPMSLYVHDHGDGSMTIVPENGTSRIIYDTNGLGPALTAHLSNVTPSQTRPIVEIANEFIDGLADVQRKATVEGIG